MLRTLKVGEDEVKVRRGGGAGRDRERKEGMERHLFCVRDRLQADSGA